jgi:CubicO group peptidase (beta-lactamase class C family)
MSDRPLFDPFQKETATRTAVPFSALVFAAVATVSLAACSPSRTESASTRVDRLFAEWNNTGSPGCSLAISRNGTLIDEHAYGLANLELRVPITPASVFSAASISKQFTAMSILLLAERGRLSLDDEVQTHVREWADHDSRVTIRHLLTHTSGLREGFGLLGWAIPSDGRVNPNEAIAAMLARQRGVNFAPGTQYQYNNGGYNLLATIVQRVSGQSFRAFADTNIFKPLGMTSTYFRDDPAIIVPNRGSGYTRDADGFHPASEAVGPLGNSGLYTTARDLLLWERNFADARVGTPALLAAMQTSTTLTSGSLSPYGFGLAIGQYRGLRTIEHAGSDRGVAANLVRYPDQGLAIALLCNLDTIDWIGLTHSVADIYLADVLAPAPSAATPPPPRVILSEDELASRAGLYRLSSNHDLFLQMSVRDRKLIGHNFYSDDADFDVTPVAGNRVLYRSGMLEFIPEAADAPKRWNVIDNDGRNVAVLQSSTFVPSTIDLQSLAGDYRSQDIDVRYAVLARDSGLVIRPPGRADIVLLPFAKDTFAGPSVGTVNFLRDARGGVVGFTVNRDNARGVRFDRVNQSG